MKTLDKIKSLITSLPSSDIELGKKFYNKRDFESLEELASSALIKVKKGLKKEKPKQEYINVNLDNLTELILEINLYMDKYNLDFKYEEEFI